MALTAIQMSTSLNGMQKDFKRNVQIALYAEGASLLAEMKDRSPIDSGLYRKRWVLSRNRFGSGNMFSGIVISNSAPHAYYMEYGAPKGAPPWFYPNPKKKRTGKLILRNGRVWAGGLNPGHGKTIGGAIGPVLTNNKKRMNELTNTIADSIIRGLK
jgi:hypothetical protein